MAYRKLPQSDTARTKPLNKLNSTASNVPQADWPVSVVNRNSVTSNLPLFKNAWLKAVTTPAQTLL